MKRKRNSLKSSQQIVSPTKTIADLHLPDVCCESIFKFLIHDSQRYLEPLSVVSKQFLSITNCLRFSHNIWCNPRILPSPIWHVPKLYLPIGVGNSKMIFLFFIWFFFRFSFLHAWWIVTKNGKLILEKCIFVCVFCVHVSRLEQEFGLLFNLKYFEENILAADWDEWEKYLNGFTKINDNRHLMNMFFEIRQQKYFEALDK